jgi:sulfatase maturation enzyme AslB (radical SAM superfamily)
MNQNGYGEKSLIIKTTSDCNFNCTFCSAKLLNIPLHNRLPEKLKEFIIQYNPSDVIVTGGEPLLNSKEYFSELIATLSETRKDYNICLPSNLMLWYKNPESFDYLFDNPHVNVVTSFQYGDERKEVSVYTEQQFKDLFKKFFERYGERLMFIYVVDEENEKYVLKACQLAKELKTTFRINQKLPLGLSKSFYPRYKILDLHLQAVKAGYKDQLESLDALCNNRCPFPSSYNDCLGNKVVYISKKGELVEHNCEDCISSKEKISIKNGALFQKCYSCKMFRLCNSCSSNRFYSKTCKEQQCKWMKEHYDELSKYNFI